MTSLKRVDPGRQAKKAVRLTPFWLVPFRLQWVFNFSLIWIPLRGQGEVGNRLIGGLLGAGAGACFYRW